MGTALGRYQCITSYAGNVKDIASQDLCMLECSWSPMYSTYFRKDHSVIIVVTVIVFVLSLYRYFLSILHDPLHSVPSVCTAATYSKWKNTHICHHCHVPSYGYSSVHFLCSLQLAGSKTSCARVLAVIDNTDSEIDLILWSLMEMMQMTHKNWSWVCRGT